MMDIAPYTLVIVLNFFSGTAAVQIPMNDEAQCHGAAINAKRDSPYAKDAFCVWSNSTPPNQGFQIR